MDVVLDVPVVALLLGVSRGRVCYMARMGLIPGAVKVGTRWQFPRSVVEPWAADHLLRERARQAGLELRARVQG